MASFEEGYGWHSRLMVVETIMPASGTHDPDSQGIPDCIQRFSWREPRYAINKKGLDAHSARFPDEWSGRAQG
jgi:hypothetical protein